MECDKCRQEREDGQTYQFYYGTKGRPTKSIERGGILTRTPYQVAGQASVWICRRCFFVRYWLPLGLSVAAVLILGLFVLFLALGLIFAEQPVRPFAAPMLCVSAGFLALGAGIVVIARSSQRQTNFGERLAIRIKRQSLERQGYNVFLTTDQYNGLERANRLTS